MSQYPEDLMQALMNMTGYDEENYPHFLSSVDDGCQRAKDELPTSGTAVPAAGDYAGGAGIGRGGVQQGAEVVHGYGVMKNILL